MTKRDAMTDQTTPEATERPKLSVAEAREEALRTVKRRFRFYVVYSTIIAAALAMGIDSVGAHFGIWKSNRIIVVLAAMTVAVLSAARYRMFMKRFHAELEKVGSESP